MIDRWIVVCERRERCSSRENLPRSKVRLHGSRLHQYRDRSEFAMYVDLEAGTEVDNDFPLLYRVDVRLEDSAPGDLSHKQQLYELSRLDDIIVYTKVEPTLGESKSGQLREKLEDPPHRALTVVLKKGTSEEFMAKARSVCGEMQIPTESPRLLIQNPLSPVAKSLSLRGQALSVEARLMTRTGPLAPEKAWLSLRSVGRAVEDAKDE